MNESQNGHNGQTQGSNPDVDLRAYFKAMVTPGSPKASSRKAWSIDVESVWVPFYTALKADPGANFHISDDALGAPLRLAKTKDGEVRFSKDGRPVMRIAKELNDQITVYRENQVAGMQAYIGMIQEEHSDAYREQVLASQRAAVPIVEQAEQDVAQAVREAEAILEQLEGNATPVPSENPATPERSEEPAAAPEPSEDTATPKRKAAAAS